MIEVLVQAAPISREEYALECSLCGPVGVVLADEVSQVSCTHLMEHGAQFVGELERRD